MKFWVASFSACLVSVLVADGTAAQDNLKPPQVMAFMKERALEASRHKASKAPSVKLSSKKVSKWPVKGEKLIPWNDPKFHIAGDLRKSGKGWPHFLFGKGKSVTYSPKWRKANAVTGSICTDAAWVDVFQKGAGYNSQLTVFVDGARINAKPIEFPPNGSLYLTRVDFGKPGRRCLMFQFNDAYFGGVLVNPTAEVWKPKRKNKFRAMFVGDSYTESAKAWAMKAAHLLGWDDAWLSGVGATGYISAPSPKLNFAARFNADVVAYRPNVLVFAGGINDSQRPPANLKKAASALFDRVQKTLPNTVVFVVGPWNPQSGLNPAVNAAVKAAAQGRPNFHWVPNNEERWITGTGYQGKPKKDGNSDFVISADGTHPTPRGHAYLAQRFAQHVRKTLGLKP